MVNFRGIPSGNQVVGLRQRPGLNHTAIAGKSFVPTPVTVGIVTGYSLPVSNQTNDDEWLYFKHSVPRRWDQVSDPTFSVHCALASAQAASAKKFKLNFDWQHLGAGIVVPATLHAVPIETDTLASALQYTIYKVDFTIDYDIDGAGSELKAGETLVGRLCRIAASATEITGEVIILDWWLNYWRGFYGGA